MCKREKEVEEDEEGLEQEQNGKGKEVGRRQGMKEQEEDSRGGKRAEGWGERGRDRGRNRGGEDEDENEYKGKEVENAKASKLWPLLFRPTRLLISSFYYYSDEKVSRNSIVIQFSD